MARRPELGRWFGRIGYLGIVLGWWSGGADRLIVWSLLGILIAVWFVAWYLAVGGLWRAPLVAAILLTSLQLARLDVAVLAGPPA